jgi:hypothetical protein
MNDATMIAGVAVTPQKAIKKYFRIDRREIHYLKFILEGYSGAAVVRTLDPAGGMIVVLVSPGCEKEVDMVIEDLRKEILIEETGPAEGEFL